MRETLFVTQISNKGYRRHFFIPGLVFSLFGAMWGLYLSCCIVSWSTAFYDVLRVLRINWKFLVKENCVWLIIFLESYYLFYISKNFFMSLHKTQTLFPLIRKGFDILNFLFLIYYDLQPISCFLQKLLIYTIFFFTHVHLHSLSHNHIAH